MNYRTTLLLKLRAERKVSFARARLIKQLLSEINEFKAGIRELYGPQPKHPFEIHSREGTDWKAHETPEKENPYTKTFDPPA